MADQKQPSRRIDAPEPGWFKIRLSAGSPWSHARIWNVMGMLVAEAAGISCDVLLVWHHGERVTPEEYFRLRDHPAEKPGKKVNIRDVRTF
jgi:hypothetical protein